MRSSTSSSDRPQGSRASLHASIAFFGLVALHLGGMEWIFRAGVPRISRIERRVEAERAGSVGVGVRPSSARSVLVIGNSLLEAGVRFDVARQALLPTIDARRFVIENTGYFDWYYGLRRLYASGGRPEVVVLVMSPRQLGDSSVRGNYFAYHLMLARDLPDVARDVNLSNTQASNLAFAHFSALSGLSVEIRKWILGLVIPDMSSLMGLATRSSPPALTAEFFYPMAVDRLIALRDLTARHGSRFIFLVPPLLGTQDVSLNATIRNAGRAARVPVLIPVEFNELSASYFYDGFHLNDKGLDLFTTKFVDSLRNEIAFGSGVSTGGVRE